MGDLRSGDGARSGDRAPTGGRVGAQPGRALLRGWEWDQTIQIHPTPPTYPLGHGLLTVPPLRPKVSPGFYGRPSVRRRGTVGDRAPTGALGHGQETVPQRAARS